MDLYTYVGNDPVNKSDPTGTVAELNWTSSNAVTITIPYTLDSSNGQPIFTEQGLTERVARDYSGVVSINGTDVKTTARAVAVSDPKRPTNTIKVDPSSTRAQTNTVGGNKITIGTKDFADAGSHELGHSAGAGDQYKGGGDVNGNTLSADVPGPGNVMKDLSPGANSQTLKEIIQAPTNSNSCAQGVTAPNGRCK